MLALMAGAKKYAASADRQRENFQPVSGADQPDDAGSKKIKTRFNHGWTRINTDKKLLTRITRICAN
jgi:predicted secreted protein